MSQSAIPFHTRGPHVSAASNEGSIDMQTMFAAAIALAMGTGTPAASS
jgi:hypothetical protein